MRQIFGVRSGTRSALSPADRADETAQVRRDELTDGGSAQTRTTRSRPGGVVRYGDRFRPVSSALALDDPRDGGDLVGLGNDRPRTWPTWLSRGAAALGLAATAVIAIAIGDRATPQPSPDPAAEAAEDQWPTQAPPRGGALSMATLVSSRVEGGLWDHGRFTLDQGRFSFEVTLSGVAATNVDVLTETSSTCTFLGGPPRFGSVYWC